jgi:ABC-type Fe3+ transport system substrate-binding protein
MSIRNSIRSTAAAAVVLGTFSAASPALAADGFEQQFADLIKAAQAEGELTWYHASLEAAGRDFAKIFETKFGVKVNYAFLVGSPGLERFKSESLSNNNIADVFNTTDGTLMRQAMTGGLIADYKVADHDAFPDGWVLGQNGAEAYPTARTQMAIAYNTELVSPEEAEKLKTWKGLLDPAFADGRLSIGDATRLGSIYSTWLYLLRENPSEYGIDYLNALAAQKPIIYDGQTEQANRIASGETDAGATVDVVAIQQYNKGAPIAFLYPDPSPVTLQFTAVSANAPHPNAARLFLEYITSLEGMAEWGKLWGAATGRPDVDATIDYPFSKEPWYAAATSTYAIQDWDMAAREHENVLKEWASAFRK